MLGSGFPGDKRTGVATLVGRVRAAVNVRFHDDDKPHILFTDRGAGFFATNTGKITPEYQAALEEHSLQAYQGNDASKQPGHLQEAMLHETAVAWIRRREAKARTSTPWKETEGTALAWSLRAAIAVSWIPPGRPPAIHSAMWPGPV